MAKICTFPTLLFALFSFAMVNQAMAQLKLGLPNNSPLTFGSPPANDQRNLEKKLVLIVSNDLFAFNHADRHLTSRVRIGQIRKTVPKPFRKYIDSDDYIVMTISQDMYTPDDINNAQLIEDERPYAGWLYLTLGTIQQSEHSMTIKTMDIGMVGPSALGEQAQKEIHRYTDSMSPQGWSHQLKDEAGVTLTYEKFQKTKYLVGRKVSAELIRYYGGRIGNVRTSANTGALYRYGFNIPNDMAIVSIDRNHSPKNFSIFFYVKLDAEYVLRDIFLDGNTFKDSHSVEKNNAIIEFTYGITIGKGRWGEISFEQSIKSKEFSDQKDADPNAEIRIVFDYFLMN